MDIDRIKAKSYFRYLCAATAKYARTHSLQPRIVRDSLSTRMESMDERNRALKETVQRLTGQLREFEQLSERTESIVREPETSDVPATSESKIHILEQELERRMRSRQKTPEQIYELEKKIREKLSEPKPSPRPLTISYEMEQPEEPEIELDDVQAEEEEPVEIAPPSIDEERRAHLEKKIMRKLNPDVGVLKEKLGTIKKRYVKVKKSKKYSKAELKSLEFSIAKLESQISTIERS